MASAQLCKSRPGSLQMKIDLTQRLCTSRALAMSKLCSSLLFILVAVLACAPQAALPPGAPNETSMAKPIERTSADDCAIIVEIGKAEMNWGMTAPSYAFYPAFNVPGGGIYLEDCPWKKLGVAEPVIGTSASAHGFFITRPVYTGDRASSTIQESISPPPEINGRKISPFVAQKNCTLKKQGGRWRLIECSMGVIT